MDNLFYAPSAASLNLAGLIQVFASLVLLPYLSVAFAGTLIGVCYDIYGREKNIHDYETLAGQIAKISVGNAGVGFLLAVVPTFAIAFCYSQFVYGSHSSVVLYFVFAGFFNLVGVLFLNKYREAFEIQSALGGHDAHGNHIAEGYSSARNYAAVGAAFFLMLGSFFVIGAIALVRDASLWQHGFGVVFLSVQVWLKYMAFVCGAFGLLGVAILFYLHAWEGGLGDISEKAKQTANLLGGTLAIVFIPLFTIFTGLHLKFIPNISYSLIVILFAALAVVVLFVVLHMVYYAFVHKDKAAAFAGMVLMIVAFLFVILTDNFTRSNSLKKHLHQVVKANQSASHNDGH